MIDILSLIIAAIFVWIFIEICDIVKTIYRKHNDK